MKVLNVIPMVWCLVLAAASAHAESFYALGAGRWQASTVALSPGWWRGFVALAEGPAEFFFEVDTAQVPGGRVTLHNEFGAARLGGLWQDGRQLTIQGRGAGECMVGELRNGVLIGRYYSGDGRIGRSVPFWARPGPAGENLLARHVWNLTGTWTIMVADGNTIEVMLTQGEDRIRAFSRVNRSGARYFSGVYADNRFLMEASNGALLKGRFESGGYLRGELIDAKGKSSFVAHRKVGGSLRSVMAR